MRHFHENARLKVVAALRRGELPSQTDRRSEIGFHTPPKAAIFIRGGELEKIMGHSYENGLKGNGEIAHCVGWMPNQLAVVPPTGARRTLMKYHEIHR